MEFGAREGMEWETNNNEVRPKNRQFIERMDRQERYDECVPTIQSHDSHSATIGDMQVYFYGYKGHAKWYLNSY